MNEDPDRKRYFDNADDPDALQGNNVKKFKESFECVSCFAESSDGDGGIECSSSHRHFLCSECFGGANLKFQLDVENRAAFIEHDLSIVCQWCLPNQIKFSDRQIMTHVSDISFEQYIAVKMEVAAVQADKTAQDRFSSREAQLQDQLSKANALMTDQLVVHHRKYIVENILTLHCPRSSCNTALLDFDGCFAVKCSCSIYFCAWCLLESGNSEHVHSHVLKCTSNPKTSGKYHNTLDEFNRVHRIRRETRIRQYLHEQIHNDHDRALVIADITQDLLDIGIVDLDPSPPPVKEIHFKDGDWKHGHGLYNYSKGGSYVGDWVNNNRHGMGQRTYLSGAVYEGAWVNDKKHGKGKYRAANGSFYKGDFSDGKPHGRGARKQSDGSTYEGSWAVGKRHGQGIYMASNGSTYDGEWKCDKRDGKGEERFKNGDSYIGDWKDDKRHGSGCHRNATGSTYDGDWVAGQPFGQGTHFYVSGAKYAGAWKDCKFDGHGVYQWPDGSSYCGEWSNGKAHGQGVHRYPNGTSYEGEWMFGKRQGWGVGKSSDGQEMRGEWQDNKFQSAAVATLAVEVNNAVNYELPCAIEASSDLDRGLSEETETEGPASTISLPQVVRPRPSCIIC